MRGVKAIWRSSCPFGSPWLCGGGGPQYAGTLLLRLFKTGWLRNLRSMIRCARNLNVLSGLCRRENVTNYIERLISLP